MSIVGSITAASPHSVGLAVQVYAVEAARDRNGGLTQEAEQAIAALKARDREVRQHEQAHKAVGGPYAGAISYEYVTGPDRQRYAVGGEVQIDASPVAGDPEATIRKMEIVRAAALAPVEPSPQDRAVAALAQSLMLAAQAELQQSKRAEQEARLEGGGENAPLQEPIVQQVRESEQTNPYTLFELEEGKKSGDLLARTV